MEQNKRSNSYPKSLSDLKQEDFLQQQENLIKISQALQSFKEKNQDDQERLASLGSPSSNEIPSELPSCSQSCCQILTRWVNYVLERGEEETRKDERIRQKSYAGFYYFIKWFIRSIMILLFTVLGSIGGKEIGCEIRDHDTCNIKAVDLAGNSPHIIATILGSICGLLSGQSFGRLVWDCIVNTMLKCLRKLEKCSDKSKSILFLFSLLIYLSGIVLFGGIFFFFVDIGHGDDNVIGGLVGSGVGIVCATIAYRRNNPCRSGQQTPMVRPISSILSPPEIVV